MSIFRPRLLVSGEADDSELCRNLSRSAELVRTDTPLSSPPAVDALLFAGPLLDRSTDLQVCARGFLDSLSDGLALISEDGRIIWHNAAFAGIVGLSESAVGSDFLSVLPADEDSRRLLQSHWPDDETTCCVTVPLSDQRFVEILASRSCLFSEDGSDPTCVSVCLRDITRQERSRRKMEAIHEAGMRLSDLRPDEVAMMSIEDRIEILKENILMFTQQILGFDTIEIRVLDPRTQQLIPLLQEGMQEEAACRLLYAREDDNGLTGFVAATGRSYLCRDTQSDPRYLRGASGARSSLTVPLKLDDVILGTFNVEGPGADSFDDEDLEFLERFGEVVAMALNQLQLLMAEKATTVEQHAERVQQEVAGPTDEILADATAILEKYIGHDPDVSETLQRILTNVRQIRSCIGQVSDDLPSASTVPRRGIERTHRPALAGKRALVVDADRSVRAEAHKLLDPHGVHVEAVPSGEAACRMMRSQTYDVVLADIRLPDMTGYECFCRMREIDAHTPIIFMTGFGYDASHSIVRARQRGLRSVLYKPFRPEQLLTEVEKAVSKPPPLE